jgi:hypothetical protein
MSEKTMLVAQLLQRAERYPGYAFCGFCGKFVESLERHRNQGTAICGRRSDTDPRVIEAWAVVAELLAREELEGRARP